MLTFEFQGNRKLRDEVTSSRLNAILTELRRIRPVAGRGINVQAEPNGSRISILDSPSVGAPPQRQPWDIYTTATEGEEGSRSWTVRIYPGTISNVLADNWDDEFEADEDTVYFGKATVTTDGQDISGVSIAFDATEPTFATPQLFSTPSSVEVLFGLFLNGKSYRTIGNGSPVFSPQVWLTLAKSGASPGDLPYDIYYTLLP